MNKIRFFLFFFLLLPLLSNAYSQEDQVGRLIKNLDSEYREIRMCSVWTLGKVKDPRALDALIKALTHKDLGVRVKAAEALGEMKETKAIEPLITALKDNDEDIRDSFANALKDITGKDFGKDPEKWQKWWDQNKDTIRKSK
jgi:HEAT repeat protein